MCLAHQRDTRGPAAAGAAWPALFRRGHAKPRGWHRAKTFQTPPGWAARRHTVPQISSTGGFTELPPPELKLGSSSWRDKPLILSISVGIWGTVSLYLPRLCGAKMRREALPGFPGEKEDEGTPRARRRWPCPDHGAWKSLSRFTRLQRSRRIPTAHESDSSHS